jgi:hypothetical protein
MSPDIEDKWMGSVPPCRTGDRSTFALQRIRRNG